MSAQPIRTYLDFEKPIAELESKVTELQTLSSEEDSVSIAEEIEKLKAEYQTAKAKYEETKRGRKPLEVDKQIKAEAGHVAWDMERFQFLEKKQDFDSIHPSLLRQSRLRALARD